MKTETILMVKKTSEYWDEIEEGTLFLKQVKAFDTYGIGFWMVHDLEERLWWIIDRDTGLGVSCGKHRVDCQAKFEKVRLKAHEARDGQGYLKAIKRLKDLELRPIWDPKKESEEAFANRLKIWKEMNGNDIR